MPTTPELTNTDSYLSALTSLAQNIIEATQQIVTLYKKQQLVLKPEDFIFIYSNWLGFIVGEKISGDKANLQQLISDTVQDHIEQGRKLYQLINSHNNNEEDTQALDDIVTTYGLIVVPVLKLTKSISLMVKQILGINPPNFIAQERAKREQLFQESIQDIFEQTFQVTVQEINALNIPNPLIFLLEHFSTIIGWLAGFFAQLSKKSDEFFLEKSFNGLNKAMQVETENLTLQ